MVRGDTNQGGEWNVYSPSKSNAHLNTMGVFVLSPNPTTKNPFVIAGAVLTAIYLATRSSDENVALSTAIVKAVDDLSGFVGSTLYSKGGTSNPLSNLPQTLAGLEALRGEIKQRQTANNGKLTAEDKSLLGNIVTQEKYIGQRNKAKRKK